MISKVTNINQIKKEMFAMPWSIYPYANFLKYGITKDFFSLYIVGKCFFTRYHDSIQICSEIINDNEIKEIADYIINNEIRMVSGSTYSMEAVFSILGKGRIEHGLIFHLKPFEVAKKFDVKFANSSDDFHQIAELVCNANSNNTGYYGLQQYYDQIFSRFLEGYCRNWIYELDKKIVGHVATYAETPLYGVLGGLAVDNDYRGQGIAKSLLSCSLLNLYDEHKDAYAFCYKDSLVNFYSSISFNSYPTSKIMLK